MLIWNNRFKLQKRPFFGLRKFPEPRMSRGTFVFSLGEISYFNNSFDRTNLISNSANRLPI